MPSRQTPPQGMMVILSESWPFWTMAFPRSLRGGGFFEHGLLGGEDVLLELDPPVEERVQLRRGGHAREPRRALERLDLLLHFGQLRLELAERLLLLGELHRGDAPPSRLLILISHPA